MTRVGRHGVGWRGEIGVGVRVSWAGRRWRWRSSTTSQSTSCRVVFRPGRPYFGTLADGHLMLEDPEVVIQGDGVLHLR
jgi:hypothetical protein